MFGGQHWTRRSKKLVGGAVLIPALDSDALSFFLPPLPFRRVSRKMEGAIPWGTEVEPLSELPPSMLPTLSQAAQLCPGSEDKKDKMLGT